MATESEMMYITVNKQIVNGERSTLCKSVKLCRFVEDVNLLISNTSEGNKTSCYSSQPGVYDTKPVMMIVTDVFVKAEVVDFLEFIASQSGEYSHQNPTAP